MINIQHNPNLHSFHAEAMNTTFTLRLNTADKVRAQEAASACFLLLEDLESQLSRYRHDSDVSRINSLATGESLLIAESTHDCLLKATMVNQHTAGLFDVTLGSLTRDDPTSLNGTLEIAPDRPEVTCLESGRHIDLGGIGKGYAVDCLAKRIKEYGIGSGLISAGASTLLAMGPETWPVSLQGDHKTHEIALCEQALSASGTGIQGAHVIHPDLLTAPEMPFKRVWVVCDTAALADAYSTACLIMDREELKGFHASREGQVRPYAEVLCGSDITPVGY